MQRLANLVDRIIHQRMSWCTVERAAFAYVSQAKLSRTWSEEGHEPAGANRFLTFREAAAN